MLFEMNSAQDKTPLQMGDETIQKTTLSLPPIAGFWRRLFAWSIDLLLLGIIGLILGAILSSLLFKIGPYGRPIGLLFIIPYFGIMNSKIGGGQTIGKRLLKTAVRNKNNEPIELGRAVARILILYFPIFLNGWSISFFQNHVITWLISLIVFGLGGAIFYTMIFNRKARQGIHDMLLGTYVVHLPGNPIESFPTTPRIHWTMTGVWFGIAAISTLIIGFIAPSLISKSPLQSAMNLYNVMKDDPRFFTVGVTDQTYYTNNAKTSHALLITVWYKGKPGEDEKKEIINSIVKTVFENEKNIDKYDALQIKITSAYDIGIASGNVFLSFSNSIDSWRKQVYPNGIPTSFAPHIPNYALVIFTWRYLLCNIS